LSASVAQER